MYTLNSKYWAGCSGATWKAGGAKTLFSVLSLQSKRRSDEAPKTCVGKQVNMGKTKESEITFFGTVSMGITGCPWLHVKKSFRIAGQRVVRKASSRNTLSLTLTPHPPGLDPAYLSFGELSLRSSFFPDGIFLNKQCLPLTPQSAPPPIYRKFKTIPTIRKNRKGRKVSDSVPDTNTLSVSGHSSSPQVCVNEQSPGPNRGTNTISTALGRKGRCW